MVDEGIGRLPDVDLIGQMRLAGGSVKGAFFRAQEGRSLSKPHGGSQGLHGFLAGLPRLVIVSQGKCSSLRVSRTAGHEPLRAQLFSSMRAIARPNQMTLAGE